MTNHPQVSIIIATFNAGRDIEGALDSVIGQQLTDWECLIIDGVSNDDTLSKAQRYADRDPRIRIYSEPDRGIFDAFNKGWRLAQGEWIYYLGSDDRLYPDGLSGLLENVSDEVEILYGDANILFSNGSVKLKKPLPLKCLSFTMITSHQAFLMRKRLIEKQCGFNIDYKIMADYDLVQRCYLKGESLRYYPIMIAGCRYTGVSATATVSQRKDALHICVKNKSNPCPYLFFWLWESKHFLGHLHKKYIKRCI